VQWSNAVSAFPQFNRLKQCRHGMMLYNVHDIYIGRSLDQYGEFSEGEADLFRRLVKPGQLVVEVGANIGAHTLLLAQLVGRGGKVLAFEPQRILYQTLCANLALNSITNVHCLQAAVGGASGQIVVPVLDYSQDCNFGGLELGRHQDGEKVPVLTIDGLHLPKCDFLKIDVEGMEQEVLEGAVQSIALNAPVLYVENDRKEKSEALIRFIDGLGYDMFWHTPPLYNPCNYSGNPANIFGQIVSLNMLGLPRKLAQEVDGLEPVRVPTADG
jgi:FkbM family methyltransferase